MYFLYSSQSLHDLMSPIYLRHPHFAHDVFVEEAVVAILSFFPLCVSWTHLAESLG